MMHGACDTLAGDNIVLTKEPKELLMTINRISKICKTELLPCISGPEAKGF